MKKIGGWHRASFLLYGSVHKKLNQQFHEKREEYIDE